MAGSTPVATTASSGALHLVLVVLAYVACISLPNVNELFQGWNLGFAVYDTARPWSVLSIKWTPTYRWAVATAAVLLAAILTSLIAGDRIQFLYFQF